MCLLIDENEVALLPFNRGREKFGFFLGLVCPGEAVEWEGGRDGIHSESDPTSG